MWQNTKYIKMQQVGEQEVEVEQVWNQLAWYGNREEALHELSSIYT